MPAGPQHTPSRAKALLEGTGKFSVYDSTGGVVTAQFAAHNLTLIPPISSGSIIHDNACGPGAVSRAILSTSPIPSNLTIHATDIDQIFLDVFQIDVDKNSWPVTITNTKSETLSFPDNTFTHSITNIGIFFTSSAGLDGAKEVFRTLQPGGTAIVNCWENITWLPPFAKTVLSTRGVGMPRPPVDWSDGKQLQKIMIDAGFKEGSLRVEKSEAWAKTKDLRGWCEKTWAFLGGLGGWHECDEEKWDEAVGSLVTNIMAQRGTKKEGDEVWMRASQWIVIATK
ncbi:S-adenosyl-L-methionine-dependent methyltransferase [Setomelanomma holmii]|uniref:S-adenosyl-L-methionine-dependent methyltransferase n=1 Tax=Setomelanomma holmii TaxID=210430 RepID=A0A9P4LJB3_9PLEO|nr:S-adenosyl-L-methionine-dependent methyltransferase [Setomelanomma holmii]